ncbi:ribophosphonate triphosphate synthase ATP transporter ATP-binding subunit [Oleiphilus messinensis]|uniref:Ribophosphonate triphosphate synthase ATP transporter ATP-binding subunit n=1 Tax=Oleiphilus messinensis TaxID=141451 RepID=A0A1Y0IHT8_9GAMM|nr:phosphonate C-P lyase system protein PhnL [Oleiphilus messinensis]ARU59416.1 ribophosphonate triphosphate synthase ATP transporter ATP-binding subunit [Oleiphilus messinensis]
MNAMIQVQDLNKAFTLHNQSHTRINVLSDVSFQVEAGECVALTGASGAGKSTLMRTIYGNYKAQSGAIWVSQGAVNPHHGDGKVNLVEASPRTLIELRRHTIGYVSQFLRVIPRVPTLDIVMEPLREQGYREEVARRKAQTILELLNIPDTLWHLAPGTFSGGEQQRVNIARCFVADYAILLLDEPTASLDAENRKNVLYLMREAKAAGKALLGIFHDESIRDEIADRQLNMAAFSSP